MTKIDLYFGRDYLCTTTQSKTCKAARLAYLDRITYGKFYNNIVDAQILKNPKLLTARKQK